MLCYLDMSSIDYMSSSEIGGEQCWLLPLFHILLLRIETWSASEVERRRRMVATVVVVAMAVKGVGMGSCCSRWRA